MTIDTAMLERLPHQPPFRFVTRLTAHERGVAADGEWEINGDEDFLQGHFPGEPIVPGVLLAESLTQLAGLMLASDEPNGNAVIRLGQVDVKFDARVTAPAVVSLHANLVL